MQYIPSRRRKNTTKLFSETKFIKAIGIELCACAVALALLFLACDLKILKNTYNSPTQISMQDKKISLNTYSQNTHIFKLIPSYIQNVATTSLKALGITELISKLAATSSSTVGDIKIYTEPLNLTDQPAIPVFGTVSSPFGYRLHPITDKYDYHTGLDIAAPLGTDIYATLDGTVIAIKNDEIYGKSITIQHENDLISIYAHCEKILVKNGQKVSKNDKIALVGSTGVSTGNHLHFELKVGEYYINPINFLNLDDLQ